MIILYGGNIMENEFTNKIYRISRWVLAILVFILFNIFFINEDISWKILPPIFALITYCLSFISTIFSKKLVNFTNSINSIIVKIILYILIIPIIIFALFLAIYILLINTLFTYSSNNISESLSHGLLFLFILTVFTIFIILPYIQSIVVFILKKICKEPKD